MKQTASILLAGAALALICAPASAQDVSTEDVYACADIAEDLARLACYDEAVGRLEAAETAGEIATVTRAEVEAVQRDSFGFSIPSLPSIALPRLGGGDREGGEEELDRVQYAVSRISRDGFGDVIVTLENGQVWRQTDRGQVRFRDPEMAEVRRAALGSYMMRLDEGRLFRVERVR